MKRFDLGVFAVGKEVTVINLDGKPSARLYVITKFYEKTGRWQFCSKNSNKIMGTFPPDGGGKYFMSKKNSPDFFYSANPEHIKEAKQKIKKAKINAEKSKRERIALEDLRERVIDKIDDFGRVEILKLAKLLDVE